MPLPIEELQNIARLTRADFIAGRIHDSHLLELAEVYVPMQLENWRFIFNDGRPPFPVLSCDFASVVLRDRVGYGNIIEGSYDRLVHSFLEVGVTAAASETILDITADEYGGPEIYVGPLRDPWSRTQEFH